MALLEWEEGGNKVAHLLEPGMVWDRAELCMEAGKQQLGWSFFSSVPVWPVDWVYNSVQHLVHSEQAISCSIHPKQKLEDFVVVAVCLWHAAS